MFGSLVLTLSLVLAIVSLVTYYLSYRGYSNTLTTARLTFHLMVLLVIVASAVLLNALLTHNYQYLYVYNYNSTDLPLGHKIASFWAGQEGSFMLWLLISCLVGVFLMSYASRRGDLEPRVMTIFSLVITFLLLMVSPLFKNPFAYIWSQEVFVNANNINSVFIHLPFLQNFIFSDQNTGEIFVKVNSDLILALNTAGISIKDFIIQGKGLNPQLLNFWMQIHPPILFTGFSLAAVPFCFALSALMKNEYRSWIKQSLPWLLAVGGVLGLGIMMGGYWAYEMLGWGGYWAWDPVENSSLIPWLVAVAAIHTMIVQKKSQTTGRQSKYIKTNLILCMLVYMLVLYSTFLTRSGVLGDASVHSFVEPGMLVYLFLIVFLAVFLLTGFGFIIYRWKTLNQKNSEAEGFLSRELSLFTAASALCGSAIVVFAGTSAPIFGRSVQTSFYNEMNIPLAIIILLLNGVSFLLKWKETKGKDILQKSKTPLALTLIAGTLITLFGGIDKILLIFLTFAACFAFFVNGELALKLLLKNKTKIGAYVAHLGIALFMLGVIASAGFDIEKDLRLTKGVPAQIFDYELTFNGYYPIENNRKYAFDIEVKKRNESFNIAPVMYVSNFNNSLMREPDILKMFTKDFYVSPLSYQDKNEEHSHEIVFDPGETKPFDDAKITFVKLDFPEQERLAMMKGKNFKSDVKLKIEKNDKEYFTVVSFLRQGEEIKFIPALIKEAQLKIELKKIDPDSKKATLIITSLAEDNLKGSPEAGTEILTVTASIKPFISFVWLGVGVMFIGFLLSIAKRLKDSLA